MFIKASLKEFTRIYTFGDFQHFTFMHPNEALLRLQLNSSIDEMFMNELIANTRLLHVTIQSYVM